MTSILQKSPLHKRKAIFVIVICIIILNFMLLSNWVVTKVKIALVSGKVNMIVQSESYAVESIDPKVIIKELEFLSRINTKNDGSALDNILNDVKSNSIKNVILNLRQKFNVNYGNDPLVWIKRFNLENVPKKQSNLVDSLDGEKEF